MDAVKWTGFYNSWVSAAPPSLKSLLVSPGLWLCSFYYVLTGACKKVPSAYKSLLQEAVSFRLFQLNVKVSSLTARSFLQRVMELKAAIPPELLTQDNCALVGYMMATLSRMPAHDAAYVSKVLERDGDALFLVPSVSLTFLSGRESSRHHANANGTITNTSNNNKNNNSNHKRCPGGRKRRASYDVGCFTQSGAGLHLHRPMSTLTTKKRTTATTRTAHQHGPSAEEIYISAQHPVTQEHVWVRQADAGSMPDAVVNFIHQPAAGKVLFKGAEDDDHNKKTNRKLNRSHMVPVTMRALMQIDPVR
jgi:hypothetical protein